jgi:hypothetical protein
LLRKCLHSDRRATITPKELDEALALLNTRAELLTKAPPKRKVAHFGPSRASGMKFA